MKIEIDQSELLSALALVRPLVSRRSPLPILSNVLVQAEEGSLTLSATDLESGVIVRCKATVTEPGTTTIFGTKFHDIIRSFPKGLLTLTLDKSRVTAKSGQVKVTLPTLSADDYPAFADIDNVMVAANRKELMRCLDMATFSAAKTDSRWGLNGIFVSEYELSRCFVSTDGHRLTLVKTLDESIPVKTLIPRDGATFMSRSLASLADEDVLVGTDTKNIIIKTDSLTITTRLMDSEFPDFHKVIPTSLTPKAVINKSDMLSALKRISPITSDTNTGIELTIADQEISVTARNPDAGEATDKFTATTKGDNTIELLININYLTESISHVPDDTAMINIEDSSKPMVITPEGDNNYIMIVMPMRK